MTVFFIIGIPPLPITFRYSPDEQSSARFARSATYRLTVFFIIEMPCLCIRDTIPTYYFSIFAGRSELRYLSVDNIFHNRDTLPSYYFFYLLEEHSSARFALSASYRLTVFFIIEIPSLVINCSSFAGRAELRSLRSLRYLSLDGIFHNRHTTPTHYFSIFAGRAELRSLRSLRYLSMAGMFHNMHT